MKSFYQYMISAPLYAVVALLVCFGSCQSSDNTKVGEGASVTSLPLTAQIGEASSRVGMSDIYGGAFSCYWNSDKLSVYHPYVLSGAVQNMTPLEFGTPATNGTSAAFSYTGSDAYRYNPGSRLYAFSKGTGGGYAASVENDGTSTLTAPALPSQNGTLADCATYDALYGSADVDYSTGLPGLLAMHHLFGMMNLHLTSSTFSTSHLVTVALTTSDGTKILPAGGGTATFNADGSPQNSAGVWGTSWSATITPTTDGVVDVYFMTWPFTGSNGTLIVSCSDDTGNTYTARTITLSGFSLAAAQLKSKPLAITSTPAANDTYSNLYAWDAIDSQPATLNTVPTNANTTTISTGESDLQNRALYACKNCPNGYEITWYMSVDCYWDEGNISGGNTTAYKLADGTTTTAGMWLHKSSGITGFSSTVSSGTGSRTPIVLTSALASGLNLSTDYFFLPAAGCTDYNTGAFGNAGAFGLYWSSTPYQNTTFADYMMISKNVIGLGVDCSRLYGGTLWTAQ